MANLDNSTQDATQHEEDVDLVNRDSQETSSPATAEAPFMSTDDNPILEGVFAISKPPTTTTPQLLLTLQSIFATSTTFAPLLHSTRHARALQEAHQPAGQKLKDEERDGRFFKLGHGGTLDPLASGVLIVGIGRGTKHLSTYLDSTKTYETVVLFGVATTTYDVQGEETSREDASHVTPELVRTQIETKFRGTISQIPPVYSGLKVDGVKAVDYVRAGRELPRDLAARDVDVHSCEMVEFMPAGSHDFHVSTSSSSDGSSEVPRSLPAARILVTVSSGFYVRSFAHDMGLACGTVATMASLHRLRQSGFYAPPPSPSPYPSPSSTTTSTTSPPPPSPLSNDSTPIPAIPLPLFTTSPEHAWAPELTATLRAWMAANPAREPGVRGPGRKKRDKEVRRQRFRGEWLAGTRRERVVQERRGRGGDSAGAGVGGE